MPIPNIPLSESDKESAFAKFISALTSFFKPSTNPISTAMIKTYTFLSAILADKPLTVKDGAATVTAAQLDAIEDALAEKDRICNEQKKTIADLQAKLAAKPAEASSQVVEDNKPSGTAGPKNDVEQFVETYNSAKKLFDEV